jgi:RNA recognition motif-containing protein
MKRESASAQSDQFPPKNQSTVSAKAAAPENNGFKMPPVPPPSAAAVAKKPTVAPPPGYPGAQQDQPPAKRAKLEAEDDSDSSALSDEQRKKLRTVFLSNLDFEVAEAELGELLGSSGPVVEVRLVKHPNGKSKGFAFVEFETRSAALAALKRDNELIRGRPMYISECDPEKRKTFKYTVGLEKNKLFVKGNPSNCMNTVPLPYFSIVPDP